MNLFVKNITIICVSIVSLFTILPYVILMVKSQKISKLKQDVDFELI